EPLKGKQFQSWHGFADTPIRRHAASPDPRRIAGAGHKLLMRFSVGSYRTNSTTVAVAGASSNLNAPFSRETRGFSAASENRMSVLLSRPGALKTRKVASRHGSATSIRRTAPP